MADAEGQVGESADAVGFGRGGAGEREPVIAGQHGSGTGLAGCRTEPDRRDERVEVECEGAVGMGDKAVRVRGAGVCQVRITVPAVDEAAGGEVEGAVPVPAADAAECRVNALEDSRARGCRAPAGRRNRPGYAGEQVHRRVEELVSIAGRKGQRQIGGIGRADILLRAVLGRPLQGDGLRDAVRVVGHVVDLEAEQVVADVAVDLDRLGAGIAVVRPRAADAQGDAEAAGADLRHRHRVGHEPALGVDQVILRALLDLGKRAGDEAGMGAMQSGVEQVGVVEGRDGFLPDVDIEERAAFEWFGAGKIGLVLQGERGFVALRFGAGEEAVGADEATGFGELRRP